MTYTTIKKTAFVCYKFIATICFDYYCKTKYFVFFIMFLNGLVVNYCYYKCFNNTSNKLILFLSYTINIIVLAINLLVKSFQNIMKTVIYIIYAILNRCFMKNLELSLMIILN